MKEGCGAGSVVKEYGEVLWIGVVKECCRDLFLGSVVKECCGDELLYIEKLCRESLAPNVFKEVL